MYKDRFCCDYNILCFYNKEGFHSIQSTMNSVDVLNISPDLLTISGVTVGVIIGFVCLCVLYVIINAGKLFHKTNNRA